MNNIRTSFSISDLENFTGIKAHTIRAWERRYGLFTPQRTEGNQRFYDLENLQKLLNVKLLYDYGHKISEIAAMPDHQLPQNILNATSTKLTFDHAIDSFKIAMLEFDQSKFERTYQGLKEEIGFRDIFIEVFIPLMEQIGLLWQVDSITPANEHFITNLIQQKVLTNIEAVGHQMDYSDKHVFVLYLPMHEIHDLGILYLHYELVSRGKRSIYLGQSVPIESLTPMISRFESITYVSYFTVSPDVTKIGSYMERVKDELLTRPQDNLWILGRQIAHIDNDMLPYRANIYPGLTQLLGSKEWRPIES